MLSRRSPEDSYQHGCLARVQESHLCSKSISNGSLLSNPMQHAIGAPKDHQSGPPSRSGPNRDKAWLRCSEAISDASQLLRTGTDKVNRSSCLTVARDTVTIPEAPGTPWFDAVFAFRYSTCFKHDAGCRNFEWFSDRYTVYFSSQGFQKDCSWIRHKVRMHVFAGYP